MSKKKGPGRPRSDDPKIHLPSITVYESTIAAMQRISEDFTNMSLSDHYQKALDFYINQYQVDVTRLGYPRTK